MDPAEPRIRTHFLAPGHAGRPAGAEASGAAENRVCGDRIEVFLAIEGQHLARLGFEAQGCGAVRATASLVCEELEGASLAAAQALDVSALVRSCGGLPPTKAHAPRVVQRALAAALADHRSRCHP